MPSKCPSSRGYILDFQFHPWFIGCKALAYLHWIQISLFQWLTPEHRQFKRFHHLSIKLIRLHHICKRFIQMSKIAKKSLLNQNLSWNVPNIFKFFFKNWRKISPKRGISIRNILKLFCIHVKFLTKEKGWLEFRSSLLGPLNIGVHSSYCLLGMMRMLQKYWMVVMPCRTSVFDISNEILRHLETNIDEVLKDLTRNLIVSAHAIPGSRLHLAMYSNRQWHSCSLRQQQQL